MSVRAAAGKTEKRGLGEFDVEGIDFLGADVASEKGGTVGGETAPRSSDVGPEK